MTKEYIDTSNIQVLQTDEDEFREYNLFYTKQQSKKDADYNTKKSFQNVKDNNSAQKSIANLLKYRAEDYNTKKSFQNVKDNNSAQKSIANLLKYRAEDYNTKKSFQNVKDNNSAQKSIANLLKYRAEDYNNEENEFSQDSSLKELIVIMLLSKHKQLIN
jgi:hypothetical protein